MYCNLQLFMEAVWSTHVVHAGISFQSLRPNFSIWYYCTVYTVVQCHMSSRDGQLTDFAY